MLGKMGKIGAIVWSVILVVFMFGLLLLLSIIFFVEKSVLDSFFNILRNPTVQSYTVISLIVIMFLVTIFTFVNTKKRTPALVMNVIFIWVILIFSVFIVTTGEARLLPFKTNSWINIRMSISYLTPVIFIASVCLSGYIWKQAPLAITEINSLIKENSKIAYKNNL